MAMGYVIRGIIHIIIERMGLDNRYPSFLWKGRGIMPALKVNKVENPIYETMDKIMEKYWDNWLIMGDRTYDPIGGRVYYYCKNRTNELERTLDVLDEDPEAHGFPDTVFVGPSRGFFLLGGTS